MSFEEKLSSFFSKVEIKCSAKYSGHLTHLYSDYVELVSLFSNSSYVSTSDIVDRLKDQGIIKQKKNDEDQAASNDENEAWVNEMFLLIQQRKQLYGVSYPFEVSIDNKVRLKKIEDITHKNKLYLFLLIASNLNLFGDFEPELTSEFEMISYKALIEFLPSHAIVKSLGANSDFTGTAIEKIKALALQLNLETDEHYLSKISTKGMKERGLDIIGWIPFEDKVGNHLTILSQCACGKEWYKKLVESRRYEKYYKFYNNKPIHAMFIPYSLINYQDSDFYQADEISVDTLMFERKRILNFIVDDSFSDDYTSKKLVEKCIAFEEDIV